MAYEEQQVNKSKPSGKSKWGAALVAEKTSTKVKKKTRKNRSKNHTVHILNGFVQHVYTLYT